LYWLVQKGVVAESADGGQVRAGPPALASRALEVLRAPLQPTLASDDPYLALTAPLGHGRSLGQLWIAATRRGMRFQAEMVLSLPGLPPLHMIARDPPTEAAEVLPPMLRLLSLGKRKAAPSAPGAVGPPSWDEPGPCDCGIPPDECTMKRFRLTPAAGAPASALPGADTFRQLTAALLDLHAVRSSEVAGVLPGDRILVATSADSRAALEEGDAVLDARGGVRPFSPGLAGVVGPVLRVVPWPLRLSAHPFRRTFSGLW
jgi:hypothetical protein